MIPHKDMCGRWVDCAGKSLDPQPVTGFNEPWPAWEKKETLEELHEDGSVNFVIDASNCECDCAACATLCELENDVDVLQEEVVRLTTALYEMKRKRQKRRKRRSRMRSEVEKLARVRLRLEERLDTLASRAAHLAVVNVELSQEKERLVKAVLSRSMGFDASTSLDEMDHITLLLRGGALILGRTSIHASTAGKCGIFALISAKRLWIS